MKKRVGFAGVNGTRLYYEIAGFGPPLVFIHGFSLDTRTWDTQFDVFAARYRVLRYDARGFGRSDKPQSAPYAHTDALLAFFDIHHSFVIGLSMGGGIAIDFALAYPEATDALIAVDGVLGGYQWVDGRPTDPARAEARRAGIPAARAAWLGGPLFAPARERPEVLSQLRDMVETYSGWHWANDNPVRGADPPAIQRLNGVRAPTLIVVGERDVLHFRRVADILVQGIPGAKKVVMPKVGHMSNMEDPTRFNSLVLEFLAAQKPPA